MIKVEFSGFGHYGICTIIPRNELQVIVDDQRNKQNKLDKLGWYNPTFELHQPIGFDRALHDLGLGIDDSDEVRFGWTPSRIGDSIESHSYLTRVYERLYPDLKKERLNRPGLWLEVFSNAAPTGWLVRASFSIDVWNIIESPAFQDRLPEL